MNGAVNGWRTPFEIAQMRDQTRRGHNHLTTHGEEVIERLYNGDRAALMVAIVTGRPLPASH